MNADTPLSPALQPAGWQAIWQYRRFIIGSVIREFRSRHSRSLLGALWLLLAPFAMILVYTVVFSQLMHARLPGNQQAFAYSIHLCAGLLPWQWFAELVSRNTGLFLDHAGLIKKTAFPRLALPIINFLASGLNFALAAAVFLMFLLVLGNLPGWNILAALPLLLLQGIFAGSLGLLLGILNVFFRDVGHAMGIFMQFWFWLTPIVYPLATLPGWAQKYIALNPVTPLIQGYQQIFVAQGTPDWLALWPLGLCTLVTTLLAAKLYQVTQHQLTDEL